jgi:hypothetical protein
LHKYNKITDKLTYKEKRLMLAHSFRGSHLLLVGLICFRPLPKQHIKIGVHGGAKPLMTAKQKVRRKPWTHNPLSGQASNDLMTHY